jgi:hypothetical protein
MDSKDKNMSKEKCEMMREECGMKMVEGHCCDDHM